MQEKLGKEIITTELTTELFKIAEKLSELWQEFSTEFWFGEVKFIFTKKASEYKDEY